MRYCPKCGALGRVCDSRTTKDGSTRRTRECVSCHARWGTVEVNAETRALLRRLMPLLTQLAMTLPEVQPNLHRFSHRNKTFPGRPRRSGYAVPPELEKDWLTLKRNGYTDDDAAASLRIAKPTSR